MAQMEASIVGTSLIAITNDLQGFDKSSWIVTAYLLTYTGKFFGPKLILSSLAAHVFRSGDNLGEIE